MLKDTKKSWHQLTQVTQYYSKTILPMLFHNTLSFTFPNTQGNVDIQSWRTRDGTCTGLATYEQWCQWYGTVRKLCKTITWVFVSDWSWSDITCSLVITEVYSSWGNLKQPQKKLDI